MFELSIINYKNVKGIFLRTYSTDQYSHSGKMVSVEIGMQEGKIDHNKRRCLGFPNFSFKATLSHWEQACPGLHNVIPLWGLLGTSSNFLGFIQFSHISLFLAHLNRTKVLMKAGPYGPGYLFSYWLFCALLKEAPFSIFACELIAVPIGFAKAVEVPFIQLFLMDSTGNDLLEAGITEGRCKIIRTPGYHGIFFPFQAAFDTLYTYFVRSFRHINPHEQRDCGE